MTAALFAGLLAMAYLAPAGNISRSHTTLHMRLAALHIPLASQTAPETPCSVPVAFLGNSPGGGEEAYYQASCASSPVQLTPSGTQGADYVAMIPGGQEVIVALDDAQGTGEPTHLVEVNIQTLARTRIADTPVPITGLSVSPSGDAVAYLLGYGGAPEGIYVQKLDGSSPVRISPADTSTYGVPESPPAWSHDGNDIAYFVHYAGAVSCPCDALVYAAASGTQVQTVITQDPPYEYSLGPGGKTSPIAWAPDDKGLLYGVGSALRYVDLSSGTGNQVADIGTWIDTLAVDRHWTAFFGLASRNASASNSVAMWLGNPIATTVYGNGLGTRSPSVDASGPADPQPPGWPLPTPTPSCPSLKFFGVRGSGETSGYGSTVQEFELTLAKLEPGLSAAHVDYPAIAVFYAWYKYTDAYINSVAAGQNTLQTDLITFWHRCPHTYVVLAGYSQGAQVVGNVADTLQPTDRARIAAVALFGDPKFNPGQPKVDVAATGYSPSRDGIVMHWPGMHDHLRQVPSDLAPRVHSYCLKNDPVCNFTKTWAVDCASGASDCPHLNYVVEEWPSKAAYWAAAVLKTLPKR